MRKYHYFTDPSVGPGGEDCLRHIRSCPLGRVGEKYRRVAELQPGGEEGTRPVPVVAAARCVWVADGRGWRVEALALAADAAHPVVELARDRQRHGRLLHFLVQRQPDARRLLPHRRRSGDVHQRRLVHRAVLGAAVGVARPGQHGVALAVVQPVQGRLSVRPRRCRSRGNGA